ncbi:hypothetical protein QM012_003399 [Aureobasidium pullulans]|uniref:N-acetyltransferase domain-containing protein n=1 Tax=Aureobasidium pullulans TaxID=5580 RepID=A0ABR0T8G8_AURPU
MTDPNFKITTSRLTISYLDPANPLHCSFLVSLWSTPEFLSMLDGRPNTITTPAAAKALIENRFLAEHARNGYGTYLISLSDSNTPIGTVSLLRVPSLLAPDIGFALLSEHMRKGYAVEAAQALISYADRELGTTAVFGFCDERNQASMATMRKLGMKWEGTRKLKAFVDKDTAVWSRGMDDVGDWGL